MTVLDEAILFATHAHEGQRRKFSLSPYILHPLEVASIIATMTSDVDVMAAGVLHDTVEDCDVSPKEIRDSFGPHVYKLVMSETEDKLADRPASETWLERKTDSLLAIQNTKSLEVKILWLGDKLSNLRSFWREYLKSGNEIWTHLNQKDPKMQEWYYRSILSCLSELSDTAAYREFEHLVNSLFGEDTDGTNHL